MLADKPEGPTSHDVVNHIRRILGVRRVGHTGTLDPFASGLLIVLVGTATRLARFVPSDRKSYEGTIALGVVTSTDDRSGNIVDRCDVRADLTVPEVQAAMTTLSGTVQQRPPTFSAKKVGGKRAYREARKGSPIALAPVTVTVDAFTALGLQDSIVRFTATVGSGTYIRALARDLGSALGCGAHLHSLRRIRIAEFHVSDAVPPDQVDSTRIRPARDAVSHLPSVELDDAAVERVQHGQAIAAARDTDGHVALLRRARLVAVGEATGHVILPRVVLGI